MVKTYVIGAGSNLRNSDLRYVNFEGENLRGVYLDGSDLSEADLSEVNLESANLTETYCVGTNFNNTNLKEANLEGMIIDDGEGNEYVLK